ncbi:MAG: hypothetical protein J07HQW2_01769 [Haloquadratum walsbyi J07HQW2]|uniref:Uncharacterized protein n=1 Tax=Haloquadratum walsbyi J07HQW2 TaxID=1238425 RepID=U1NE82_9EURY|nr:MAG: hypothetical protein J07HQW2_01769 [Haloquadratum walsbyi J07HQW2]
MDTLILTLTSGEQHEVKNLCIAHSVKFMNHQEDRVYYSSVYST